MTTRRFILASLATIGLLLAGCAPSAAPPAKPAATTEQAPKAPSAPEGKSGVPAPTPKVTGDQPRYGGILVRTHYEDTPTFDLHQESSNTALMPLANAYNGLVRYDPSEPTSRIMGDLAEKWDSPDGKVWTFQLRKGVQWHDGQPFTSEDARFSMERMAFWKEYKIISPRAGAVLTAVEKVEAPDPTRVRITLKYPSASFLINMASGWVIMKPKHVIQAKGDMKRTVVGTGAFTLKNYAAGVSIEMAKNPKYFLPGLPYMDGILVYYVKDDATSFAALRTGKIRMTTPASRGLTHPQAEILRREMADRVVVHTYSGLFTYQTWMNLATKPYDDVRVRKAVNLTIDRQAAIKVNFNAGKMGTVMDPKGAWGITEEEIAKRPGYRQPKDQDLAEAKRLLAEAGYPNGFSDTMLLRSGGVAEAYGVVVKEQLAKVGIKLELLLKEPNVAKETLRKHQFTIGSYAGTYQVDDPDATFGGFFIKEAPDNWTNFFDPQIEDMFVQQAKMMDPAQRKKIVIAMQERLLELVPVSIGFWDMFNIALWKEIRGYLPGVGIYTNNNLDHVWLAK